MIRIETLTEANFHDFETLTSKESGGGCYCSFWHQKITSMQEWDTRKKDNPQLNRQIVLDKVKTGYHVGVLAYKEDQLLAWISVGTMTDFYWTWKRLVALGEEGKNTAAIMCFTIAPAFRGQKLQSEILTALVNYGSEKGWNSIEAYPFEKSALEKHREAVLWPGMAQGFEKAGFVKQGPHWLSAPDWERSLYKMDTINRK